MNGDFYKREIVITADGSSSIFLPEFNEHYHSHHGAVQESKHVFMKMGWEKVIPGKSHVDILEVGFGAGLNSWLVCDEVKNNSEAPLVHYTSLELYPVSSEDAAKLNYIEDSRRGEFMSLHLSEWDKPALISQRFTLEKLNVALQDFASDRKFNLVFFDAFAPRVQPEMWTKEIFDKMFSLMKPGGILVTYCSKGEVRRNMIAAGFEVEKVPGPPGKREMIRCAKF